MKDVAIACPCNCLLPSLSGSHSLKSAGCAVGYDDLADDCSFNVVHASSLASSHRREALMPTWSCSYSGFVPSTMQGCKLRPETLHLQGKLCTPDSCGLKSIVMFLMPLHQRLETVSQVYMCHAVNQCWLLPPVQFNVHLDRCVSQAIHTSHTAFASTWFLRLAVRTQHASGSFS